MEILTIKETAEVLNVPVSQVYALARYSEGFPAFHVGKHWRIPKERLIAWVDEQVANK